MMTLPNNSGFMQAAWIVNDVEGAARRWSETTGIGPFFIIRHAQVLDVRYRGAPAELDFSAALAQAGPLQIELIQQHGGANSAYRDVYAEGEEGFHHVCTMVHDFDSEMRRYAQQGVVAVTEGAFGDMRYAYVDTRPLIGHMTEIIEDKASIKEMFGQIASAAACWDGSEPLRSL
jgi:catechol 2,3-dioxygenase-like lactoylglutathione lyase family enzyme